jgi:hypothetical protein
MVYAIQLRVGGLTQAEATAAATAIKTRLSAKPRWDAESVGAFKSMLATTWEVSASANYTTRADIDAISATAVAWLNANVPAGATGTLYVHDCTHDEDSPVGCVATLVWSKP